MAISAIAHIYWRSIKSGVRTYESVPPQKEAEVLALAKTDVVNGVITVEDYYGYIGVPYEA